MTSSAKKLVYWTPRILSIFFALFISIFALDVFGAGYNIWQTILALFIHLIPTFTILLVLAISWRREWIGGIIFFALGIAYIVMAWGKFNFATYLLISGPLFLIGILFMINWFYRSEIRKT